jgi:segregation and condensation protein B
VDTQHAKLVLEAALLAAQEPLPLSELGKLFDDEIEPQPLEAIVLELQADWQPRSVELVCVAAGWRFQTKPDYKVYLDKLNPEKAPKYARSVLETLAIIAYKQPVTRGDIENIRGVTVASEIIKKLEERGWIEIIGHRDVPGRPSLFATTKDFLNDLGLRALSDLPPLQTPETMGDLLNAAQTPMVFELGSEPPQLPQSPQSSEAPPPAALDFAPAHTSTDPSPATHLDAQTTSAD